MEGFDAYAKYAVLTGLLATGCGNENGMSSTNNSDEGYTGVDSDTGSDDTGVDSGETDTEADSGGDTGKDTDTGADTGRDTASDTGVDTGKDTGTDTGTDLSEELAVTAQQCAALWLNETTVLVPDLTVDDDGSVTGSLVDSAGVLELSMLTSDETAHEFACLKDEATGCYYGTNTEHLETSVVLSTDLNTGELEDGTTAGCEYDESLGLQFRAGALDGIDPATANFSGWAVRAIDNTNVTSGLVIESGEVLSF